MENNIKSKLLEIKKNIVVLQTYSSYVVTLSDIFLKDISLFQLVCDTYGLEADDVFSLLRSGDIKSIPLLDEIVQFCALESEKKDTRDIEFRR